MKIKTLSQKDFDWVKWNSKKIEKEAKKMLEETKKVFSKIKSIKKEERGFENTIFALEKSYEETDIFFTKIDILSQAHPQKDIRKAAQKYKNFLSEKFIDINFDKEIYQAILDYKKYGEKREVLESTDKILLKKIYEEYKDMGFSLPKKTQEKLKKINKKISKLSSDFFVNINNHQDNILLSKKEINGLSDIFLQSLKKEKGKFVVSLDHPEMIPFMENSENEIKRKELSQKASKKGGKKNLIILNEILKLKKEKVKILGYKSYPDYVTKNRMAKKGKNIENFFESLLKKIEKKGIEDLKVLEQYKQKKKNNKKEKLFSYDIAYYNNLYKKENFGIDEEKNKEFFQLEEVKKEMINMFGKLFNFKMKKNNTIKLWHKDIEFYDVFQGGKKISHIIFDLFPREGKDGGACMIGITSQCKKKFNKKDKQYNAPTALINCNFSKATKKIPSLVSHLEMEIIFHEFGHALHHTLAKSKYANNSGSNVAWDFIETPSQLLENWAIDQDFLYKVSKHWKTGEKNIN